MTDLETAQNPQTDPATLVRLIFCADQAVCQAVARNPNTPELWLEKLAVMYPEAVLDNPLLEWLRFENPAWFTDIPVFARRAMLRSPNCPVAWLEAAGRLDTEARLAALGNAYISVPILEGWLRLDDVRVTDAIFWHVAQPLGQVAPVYEPERNSELFKDVLASGLPLTEDILALLATDFDAEVRAFVAARADLPDALLESLALDEDDHVARAAKANRVCDFATRAEALALHKPKEVARLARGQVKARRLAAQHPSISANLLKQLYKDDEWRVRQDVARNPKTPAKILAKLAADYDRDVREAVASNLGTPSQVLERLLSDSHEAVAKAARENKNAPSETLRLLERLEKKDPSLTDLELLPHWLAVFVAGHPNATAKLLETFAKSDAATVRIAVAGNPQTPLRLLEVLQDDADIDVLIAMLQRPNLPDTLLTKLALHPDARVTEQLSVHQGLSKRLLEQLSGDASWQVRRNIAAHRRCPVATLEALAQDTDADVREAAVFNPNANALVALHGLGVELRLPQVLTQITSYDVSLNSPWLEFVARRGNDLAKRLVASHPHLSPEIMTWFLTFDDWKIRRGLAQNPNLSATILEKLSTDTDRDVRASVAAHPNLKPTILALLAHDSDAIVRRVVAVRGVAHEHLCWDEDETVLEHIPPEYLALRRKLEANQSLTHAELEALLPLQIPSVMQRLPKTAVLPNLELCLQHESWKVRQAAVRNLHCTTVQLELLLSDSDRDVRTEIARHPNATPALLAALMRDDDLSVRRATLSNQNLEPSLLQTAQRFILDECLRSSSLNRIVALRLTTRVSELKKRRSKYSLEWRERLAMLQNPLTPTAIQTELTQDANRTVRALASQKLEERS